LPQVFVCSQRLFENLQLIGRHFAFGITGDIV
jgi:hypothetical protein